MVLTVQPQILSGLMNNSAFRGRGLTARFLFAVCPSKVGRRKIDAETIPQKVKQEYCAFVRRILSGQGHGIIHLSPDASRLLKQYAQYVEARLADDWEHMRDWAGKLTGAMLRIAALFHCAEAIGEPADTTISTEVMSGAISVAEFFGAHAAAAYQLMGADDTIDDAKYLLRRLLGSGADQLSRRDLFRLCHGKFRRAEDMQPAIDELTERGYIREIEQSTGGRPTRTIFVNPLANKKESI
jgi:hypothetical protein